MTDDYLWDRSGEPDPEIARLEKTLGSLGASERPLEMPEAIAAPAPERGRSRHAWVQRIWWVAERPALPRDMPVFGVPARVLSAAAVVLAVAGALALWMMAQRAPTWRIASVEGAPRVAQRPVTANARLGVGEWLETDATSRARLSVGKIGDLLLEPNTRLQLLESGDRRQRLHLALGTLTAAILAPPRQFVVETPSARAVDMGCAYTLEVDATGGGFVTVLVGWVSFERDGRESLIPAGARCATHPATGPGTPYFTDASDRFKNALAMLDIAGDDSARAGPLRQVLDQARREDAFTLWHLLERSSGDARGEVFARLAALVPPPAGVTRPGVMAGDRAMLDRWWEEFGFGEMKWWRLWRRSWPQPSSDPAARSVGPS